MDLSKLLEEKRKKQAKRKAKDASGPGESGFETKSENVGNLENRDEHVKKKMDLGEKSVKTKPENSPKRQAKQSDIVSEGQINSEGENVLQNVSNSAINDEPLTKSVPSSTDNRDLPKSTHSSISGAISRSQFAGESGKVMDVFEGSSNESKGDKKGDSKDSKEKLYQAYLDRENKVPLRIEVSDISERNLPKLKLQIRKFLKDILGQWTKNEEKVAEMAEQKVAEMAQKKSLLSETKKDIVKLLYKLRSGKLSEEMVISLSTIVHYVQEADVLKANEAYLKLSIGNVAWPIGVRDVGIHARAADAKIAGDDKSQLANIMKSESTRRWLIAVKRVLNYCGELLAM